MKEKCKIWTKSLGLFAIYLFLDKMHPSLIVNNVFYVNRVSFFVCVRFASES